MLWVNNFNLFINRHIIIENGEKKETSWRFDVSSNEMSKTIPRQWKNSSTDLGCIVHPRAIKLQWATPIHGTPGNMAN